MTGAFLLWKDSVVRFYNEENMEMHLKFPSCSDVYLLLLLSCYNLPGKSPSFSLSYSYSRMGLPTPLGTVSLGRWSNSPHPGERPLNDWE